MFYPRTVRGLQAVVRLSLEQQASTITMLHLASMNHVRLKFFFQVSVRVYFRKLYESDFGFWGFRILGDFAGGCESGRSSTFLEPRSPPGSFTYSPRVSSCKVNNSSKVIFF